MERDNGFSSPAYGRQLSGNTNEMGDSSGYRLCFLVAFHSESEKFLANW